MGFLAFFHYRRDNKRDRHFVDCELKSGATLQQSLERALTLLNEAHKKKIRPTTIATIAERLARLSEITDADNIVDIYTQFVHMYILFERRFRKTPLTIDDAKLLYAVEHLDLTSQGDYFLIRPSREADFKSKYPAGF